MGAGYHGGFGKTKGTIAKGSGKSCGVPVAKYPPPDLEKPTNSNNLVRNTTLHFDSQGKHIEGHRNYMPGKSIFSETIEKAADLVQRFSGKGMPIGENKERVNFDEIIGYYIDVKTLTKIPTTVGIIHYSKKGAHIVPAQPKKN